MVLLVLYLTILLVPVDLCKYVHISTENKATLDCQIYLLIFPLLVPTLISDHDQHERSLPGAPFSVF